MIASDGIVTRKNVSWTTIRIEVSETPRKYYTHQFPLSTCIASGILNVLLKFYKKKKQETIIYLLLLLPASKIALYEIPKQISVAFQLHTNSFSNPNSVKANICWKMNSFFEVLLACIFFASNFERFKSSEQIPFSRIECHERDSSL